MGMDSFKRKKSSLHVIAKEAGVSVMTASRAINGTGPVANSTAQRIRKIADKHKYRPNLLIRGVQTGRTMNIGVIFPAELGFYTRVLAGIHDQLLRKNYSIQLSLLSGHMGAGSIRQEQRQLLRLVDLRVDGIILRSTNDEASDLYFKEVFERGIPLVAIDRKLDKVHCDYVGTNDIEAGRRAADYLMGKGHRNILLVATGDMISTGRDRRDGFLETAVGRNANITIINEKDFEYHEEDARRALNEHPEITAAFCVNDTLAAGLYRTAVDLGLHIPESLSILGFGNLGFCSYLHPALSSFDQHPIHIGKYAAQRLIKRIESVKEPTNFVGKVFTADLIERDSVSCI